MCRQSSGSGLLRDLAVDIADFQVGPERSSRHRRSGRLVRISASTAAKLTVEEIAKLASDASGYHVLTMKK